jgi:hypothetical protein
MSSIVKLLQDMSHKQKHCNHCGYNAGSMVWKSCYYSIMVSLCYKVVVITDHNLVRGSKKHVLLLGHKAETSKELRHSVKALQKPSLSQHPKTEFFDKGEQIVVSEPKQVTELPC